MSPRRSIEATLSQVDRFGILERRFAERFGSSGRASENLRIRFNRTLNGFATPLSFATVALVAVALHACFRRRRPLFVEHLVFSMHFFTFVLFVLLVPTLFVAFRPVGPSVIIATMLLVNVWQFVYLAFAIRRFYLTDTPSRTRAWVVAAGLAVTIGLLNSFAITAIQFAGAAFAIMRL
jgi:uncharacterized membrane protein